MEDRSNQRLKQGNLSRRQFLSLMWWGSAALLAIEGGAATLASLWPRTKSGAFGSTIAVGKVADLALGSLTYHKEGRFYLSRVDSGLLALYRNCTHLGCVVPWRADEISEDSLAPKGRFNCPCHGSIFDRFGVVKGGPAPRPLDIFPITLDNGEAFVDTGTIVRRVSFDKSQVTKV